MCFTVPFDRYKCVLCAQVHSWEQVGACPGQQNLLGGEMNILNESF